MLNTFKALQAGRLMECQNQFAFPVMRWMSGAPENLEVCSLVDINFFRIKPEMVFSLLYQCPKKGFLKYPKKTKAESDEREEIIERTVKKLYCWSDMEYEKNKRVIPDTDEFITELNKIAGFDQKECKKLGIDFKKAEKYEFKDKPKTKNIFEFG